MKKITATIAMMFFLVSCGKETVVVMQPPVTDAPVQQGQDYGYGSTYEEEMLISFVESQVGSLYGVDMQLLVDTGYMICGELRLGATIEDLVTIIIASSSDASTDKFLTALAAGSIKYLCPDQAYKLDAITSY